MATFGGPVIPGVTDGLVAYWDSAIEESYPDSGNTWFDMVGGYNATLVNNPTFNRSGRTSNFDFDGTNDGTTLGDVLDMGLNSVSVCTWINVESITNTGGIFGKQSARFFFGRYWFNIQITSPRTGKIRAGFHGNNEVITDGITDLRNTGWRMISVIWNRTSNCQIYVDTTLDAQSSISEDVNTNLQNTDITRIGSHNTNNGSTLAFPFNGKIANLWYYTRVLSLSEITQNYNATKGRFGL